MKTKLVLKKKYKIYLTIVITQIIIILLLIFYFKVIHTKNYIDDISINENKITIKLKSKKNYECLLSNKEANINDKWIKSNDGVCILDYSTNSDLYLKYKNKIINATSKLLYIDFNNNETIYLAKNDEYNYYKYIIGNKNKIKKIEFDKNIITISDDGIIKAINKGETKLNIKYSDSNITSNIIVTDLITKRPINEFDFNKDKLSCEKFSKEENDLLDKILENRISNVGYKTRAGVVEAARFLTLDFPYRINYFYENGRQTTNNIDGEGRYYHIGLYLDKSRFENITGSISKPQIWGCSLYSNPVKKNEFNGLDCSGFVSWALLNGGFDVKDVGAGWSDKLDLTDYGEVIKIDDELIKSNKIKVGDLLHSEQAGGHIGIIVGLDDKYYYVAQALWYKEIGVQITNIEKDKLSKSFVHAVLMDKYYKDDGNLTNMW